MNKNMQPDFLFETSWEICNMMGGIYTVLSTKAKTLKKELGDNLIMIGPEVWKETSVNPDFEEDRSLLSNWTEKAYEDGLNFRIGRWKIAGKPIVILVDFTQYFSKKDEIFKDYWESFRLDSLQGGWDYVEPAMFGYAAAKVIEHFYKYNVTAYDKISGHFHEWMTGLGLLYLKKNTPQVATVFTTHATILGRSIAGKGMPLYSKLEEYNSEEMSRRLGIPSKFSMEKLAAQKADVLTTVSDTTARECETLLGRKVDEVTPNGFDDAFAPSDDEIIDHRKKSREVIHNLSKAVKAKVPDKNAFFVATSGRYEYTNKGIDVFLEALSALKNENPSREIWGYVLVPGGHKGPDKTVLERWNGNTANAEPLLSTHRLENQDNDPVISTLKNFDLINGKDAKVHVVFVPAYLDGKDGLLNMSYYQLLSGFDLTVFPSYYEPWGYTPLESLAYRVPTVTTSLTGMGQWVKDRYPENTPGIKVIERNESNREEVINQIAGTIKEYLALSAKGLKDLSKNAWEISRIALWSNLISHYYSAYNKAIAEADKRFSQYEFKEIPKEQATLSKKGVHEPQWKKILIEPTLPSSLEKLRELTRNIWWTWDHQAKKLFASIQDGLWKNYNYNPIYMLERMTYEQLNELANDKNFLEKLDKVYNRFKAYMKERQNQDPKTIAYFSMEYGLHDTIKTYSGGLGMLAGDYLKEASDSNVNMVAVGLLYRYGYFIQKINRNGEQQAEFIPQKFTHLPLIPVRDEKNDEWITISLALPGRNVTAKVWKLNVGRVPLYLLDTDIEENSDNDRFITHQLYGGDIENRFKQEFLLGIGGVRMLDKLGVEPTLYHINEGHAAFIGLERLRKLIHRHNISFHQAMESIKGSSLFTTHTPVPAGHDAFDEDVLRRYIPHYAERLKLDWNDFMALGRRNPEDHSEKFSMSILALRLSQEINGVSKLHGEVSRDMFKDMFPGYLASELHIDYVTNGVHYANWTSGSWRKLHNETFGRQWKQDMANPQKWKKIYEVEDSRIWDIRNYQRQKLVKYLKERLEKSMMRHQESPRMFRKIENEFSSDKLTIGFARRFATYKRAHLLFKNLERLSAIINNKDKPVQFVFAGKAHPNDKAGQDLLKWIIDISKREEFAGKILFVEDYDIRLGRKLVQGVDVWLNTPTRPLEASGTSGEKAAMNGVLNCSVLDGWWAEGYVEGAGWALPMEKTFNDQNAQDELDSETLYDLLEEEVIPAFYNRDENNIPDKWIKMIKKNIAEIAPHFTTRRMLNDYFRKFYRKLFEQNELLTGGNYSGAKELVRWKRKLWSVWDDIKVQNIDLPEAYDRPLKLGDHFQAEIELYLPGLSPEEIGIEIVFGHKEQDKINEFVSVQNMEVKNVNENSVTYICDIPLKQAGVLDYAFRLYPKHKLLPHRQSFNLVKWL